MAAAAYPNLAKSLPFKKARRQELSIVVDFSEILTPPKKRLPKQSDRHQEIVAKRMACRQATRFGLHALTLHSRIGSLEPFVYPRFRGSVSLKK
jgi:hypothetical protein